MTYDGDDPRWGDIDFPRPPWKRLVLILLAIVAVAAGLAAIVPRLVADGDETSASGRDVDLDPSDPSATEPPSLEDLTADVTLPEPDEGLRVADQGVTTVADRFDQDRQEGTFAVVVENPHDDWLAQGVEVSVTLLAADGAVVEDRNGFIDVLLPTQSGAFAGLLLDLPAPAESLTVDVEVARWRRAGPTIGAFEIRDVVTEAADFTGVTTTAVLTSTFAETLRDVGVIAVYRDADGAIIGGYETFVDEVRPDAEVPITVDMLASIEPASVAETEVYTTAAFGFAPGSDPTEGN